MLVDSIFSDVHGDSVSNEKFIIKKTVNLVNSAMKNEAEISSPLPPEVITTLVRTRTFIRIKEINKTIKMSGISKRNIIKKIKKIA